MVDLAHEVLARLPLAEAVWWLLRHVLEERFLASLFEEHRGTGSEQKVSFGLLVQLINAALWEHRGSGRQAFRAARETGQLAATDAAVYGKLRRVPVELSEAFLRRATTRLREVLPENDSQLPPSVRELAVLVVDGKKLKQLPKRLRPLREVRGKVLGGKVVVGLLLNEGLVVTMHASPDGEANDAPLTPGVLAQSGAEIPGRHLYVADRQFCDLKIPRLIDAQGHAFLVRFSLKTSFVPELQREFHDAQGRLVRDAVGWMGRPADERRMLVRQITLVRPGEEDVILVTNLQDATAYPAEELLEVYLERWSIERVFQQITEVFHLQKFIGSTPQGAIFQFALCALLYNLVHVVRAYVAQHQRVSARQLSSEMIFGDVCDQLTAAALLLDPPQLALPQHLPSSGEVQARLHHLLANPWKSIWLKCPPKKKRHPTVQRPIRGGHSSAWKLLQAAKAQPPPR